MKRIAIELYGLTRSYKATFDSFFFNLLQENYKDGYIIDIFIHTWSESDSSDINWRNPNGNLNRNNLNNFIYKDLINKYNPKAIIVDSPLDIDKNIIFDEKICNHKRSYSSLVSCFYSRHKVNELRKQYEKENNIEYDWVLMTRFDVLFNNPLRLETYTNDFKYWDLPCDKNAVYTAPWIFNLHIEPDYVALGTDLVLFSSAKTIDTITEFYNDLKTNKINAAFILDNSYGMETLWAKYWQTKNINKIQIRYFMKQDYDIARTNIQISSQIPFSPKTFKARFKLNIKQIWQYFKPFFSWFSEIFSIFYYLLKISMKTLERLFRCI